MSIGGVIGRSLVARVDSAANGFMPSMPSARAGPRASRRSFQSSSPSSADEGLAAVLAHEEHGPSPGSVRSVSIANAGCGVELVANTHGGSSCQRVDADDGSCRRGTDAWPAFSARKKNGLTWVVAAAGAVAGGAQLSPPGAGCAGALGDGGGAFGVLLHATSAASATAASVAGMARRGRPRPMGSA
jgi:hypothetical protein